MYGINEIYGELLLEAKSIEEIKQILEYQFVQGKGVPQEVFDNIFNIDPTKKKSYTKWTLLKWDNESKAIINALKSGRLATLFKYAQQRANNGFSLDSSNTFADAINMLPDEDPIFTKQGNGPEDDFDIVFDSPEWRVVVPHTFESDKKLGKGCRWCTADAFGNGESYWRRYSSYGTLWINFDKRGKEICPMDNKEYPYIRYQWLFEFENGSGEFMDCNDNRITPNNLDVPEDVKEFYESQNEEYGKVIEEGPDKNAEDNAERYENERLEAAIPICANGDGEEWLALMPEENDDFAISQRDSWYVYDMEYDTSDPFNLEDYDKDDFFVESLCGNDRGYTPAAVLKDRSGCYHIFYASISGMRRAFTWESSDIDTYGKINDYYFYYISDNTFYLVGEDDAYQGIVDKTYMEILKTNNIESVKGTEYSDDSYLLDIELEDGFHSALLVNLTHDILTDFIISYDIPKDENFKIYYDAKGGYIVGKHSGKRYLDEENRNDSDFHICRRYNFKDNVFEVEFSSNNEDSYNLYDGDSKRMLLNENCDRIEYFTDELAIIHYNGENEQESKSGYFSISLKDFEIPLLYDLKPRIPFQPRNNLLIGYESFPSEESSIAHVYYIQDDAKITPCGAFNGIFKKTLDSSKDYPFVIYRNNRFHYFYDIFKKESFGLDNIIMYGEMNIDDVIMLKNSEGNVFIYNFLNRNIIINRCDVRHEKAITNEYFIYKDNGKCILASKERGALTSPYDNLDPIYIRTVAAEKNGRITWLLFDNETPYFWPSKEGIPKEYIENYNNYATDRMFYNLAIPYQGKNIRARLYPIEKRVDAFTIEDERVVNSIILANQSAIREEFNRILKKITEYGKDTENS